jgi:uncharacterized membrane protein YfcA
MEHASILSNISLVPFLAVMSLSFLLAGFVKGVLGLGLPTVAIGILGLMMAPTEAAALLIIPSLVTNVWQLAAGPSFTSLIRRLWPMLLGIFIGTLAGIALFTGAQVGYATAVLGGSLMLYSALGMAPLRLAVPARAEPVLAPLIGAGTGLVTAVTGMSAIPSVPYLQALELDKDELVQALGLAFTVSTIALAIGLACVGTFRLSVAGTSFLALVPALGGMFIGQRVRALVSPAFFRRCFFLGMLALGAHLLLKAPIW